MPGDDLPYTQRFNASEMRAIRMSAEFNDLPHAMCFGHIPSQFVSLVAAAPERPSGSARASTGC